MELDKRIIEGKKPLDCFDAENKELIKPFLNKEGYFSNNLENFCLLGRCFKRLLINVFKERKSCFTDDEGRDWKFFLPVEWAKEPEKEPEKKFRAFTLAEWIDQHEIGEVIHCRNEHKQEFHVMYTGYVIDNGEEDIQDNRTTGQIMLINMGYLLQELFERYEICINGEWLPFGVVEDD